MKFISHLKWQFAILALAAMVGFTWAQQPAGAVHSTLTKTKATVTAIDPAKREVTIQGDKGPLTIQCGPDVKNFKNLKVGDQVLISYYQGAAAQIVKGGKTVSDPAGSTFAYGNSPGMKPAGGIGQSMTETVKVQDITHIIQVKSPEMQKFLRELKPGIRWKSPSPIRSRWQ